LVPENLRAPVPRVERAWRHPVWAGQSELDVSLPHVWPAVVEVSRPKKAYLDSDNLVIYCMIIVSFLD